MPLLQCIEGEEAIYILYEIHKDVFDIHAGGLALVQKVL